ncbi:helix-turn-helix domain-containing protein [Cryobacterium sp. GrIS_2_6]|uniref:helix-turn-helix domain-containing protein n=1 Tax=Cryobacterium sp. GrIS_2_6 TaxID=3162785 RepID=UPI002E093D5F|nr:putative DNA-binding transcriptional regulator AlpA [Cryobacterium psychrotolerans]
MMGASCWDNAGQRTDGRFVAAGLSFTRPADRFFADSDRNMNETTPPMMDDDAYWEAFPETLSTTNLAKILSVGKPAVLARLKSGVIPGHLIVGSWVLFKVEIRAWLESTSNQPSSEPPPPVDVLAGYDDEMSYRDLMLLMGKTKQTIYTWLHNGEIPAFHVANRWIIRKSQLRQKLRETSNQVSRED